MAFLGSFLQYIIIFIFLSGVSVAGVFVGKFLRNKRDEKNHLEGK